MITGWLTKSPVVDLPSMCGTCKHCVDMDKEHHRLWTGYNTEKKLMLRLRCTEGNGHRNAVHETWGWACDDHEFK